MLDHQFREDGRTFAAYYIDGLRGVRTFSCTIAYSQVNRIEEDTHVSGECQFRSPGSRSGKHHLVCSHCTGKLFDRRLSLTMLEGLQDQSFAIELFNDLRARRQCQHGCSKSFLNMLHSDLAWGEKNHGRCNHDGHDCIKQCNQYINDHS